MNKVSGSYTFAPRTTELNTSATKSDGISATLGRHKVKKQSGLMNALNRFMSFMKKSFRSLEDFVCQPFSWKEAAREAKHKAKEEYLNCRISATNSKKEKAKFHAQKMAEKVEYKFSGVKNDFSRLFKS